MTEAIEREVAERAGINLEALGFDAFRRAVAARMEACTISDPASYAERLRASPLELETLVEELTVRETWFFRDRGPFELLEQFARTRRNLRLLSAPCASGEEAYSIAITLLDAGWKPERFHLDACDISRRALEAAARATYGPGSFREDWRDYRSRWFQPAPGGLALRPNAAGTVAFHRDNLLHPGFLAEQEPYDVVFCRNLLIYLRAEAQRELIRRLGGWLKPDGVLVVGHAEVAVLFRYGYEPVSFPRCFACRKSSNQALPSRSNSPVRRVESAPPRPVAPPPAASPVSGSVLEWARQLADEGALEDAWKLCEEVLAREADAEAHYLQGLISSARDELSSAEESFRKALYLDPAHYESLVQMSVICNRRGEPARGDVFRARAVRLAPRREEAPDARRP